MATTKSSLRGVSHSSAGLLSAHRPRTVFIGLAPIAVLYALYTFLRWTVVERASSVGDHNAERVLSFEQRLNLDWEMPLQQHAVSNPAVVWFVNHYYVFAFFPVLVTGAVLAALRAPRAFEYWRSIFVVSLGLALVGFAFFPLTPPRLLPSERGYIDTLMLHGPRYYGDESGSSLFNAYGSIPSVVNEYAAMPSMHVGWSAIAAVLILAAFPGRRWLVALAIAHIVIMQVAVVATGNHYLIDGIVGLLIVF